MERFVVYSEEFGYFKNCYDKSLQYHEGDFVEDVEVCKWWKSEDKAFELATDLSKKFKTNCVRIYVGVDILDSIPTQDIIDKKLKECKVIIDETDALSTAQVNSLSDTRYRKYTTAKRYVETYG